MNLYVVVEGAIGEKKVYSHWIPLVNPNLKLAGSILDIGSNSVFIVGGGGYPNYFEVIEFKNLIKRKDGKKLIEEMKNEIKNS